MEALKTTVENLIDNNQYNKATNLIAEAFSLELKVKEVTYKSMKWDNIGQYRYVFKLQLCRGKKKYTFDFGQSIAEGNNEPTLYDVLACLQKYEVGTFENFCDEFGYDLDSSSAKKTYKAVVKEYDKMCSLFNSDELEVLQLIS